MPPRRPCPDQIPFGRQKYSWSGTLGIGSKTLEHSRHNSDRRGQSWRSPCRMPYSSPAAVLLILALEMLALRLSRTAPSVPMLGWPIEAGTHNHTPERSCRASYCSLDSSSWDFPPEVKTLLERGRPVSFSPRSGSAVRRDSHSRTLQQGLHGSMRTSDTASSSSSRAEC
jgi:hypothetical protein